MCSESLISTEISKFYLKEIGDSEEDARKYYNQDLSLNFSKIFESLLNRITVIRHKKDFQELTYENFLCCYDVLKPVLQESVTIISENAIEAFNLKWLGSNAKYLLKLMESTISEIPREYFKAYDITTLINMPWVIPFTANVEKVLLLTAMLEYALGCVYYTLSGKRSPPHLLRDLLSTRELLEFFGYEAVTFLRILMGTPNSINLRNIVWHGFPQPEDIPSYYVAILVLIVHTLGNILEEKQLALIYRTQVTEFEEYIKEFQTDIPFEPDINAQHINLIVNSRFIYFGYRDYWIRLFSLIKSNRYSNFNFLVLPQIELILRIKYAKINNIDISAKLNEYYITMDTIFEPIVPQKTSFANRLLSKNDEISEGALKLLYDLFIAPNGPRLRDKVSHGEVAMEALVCQVLRSTLLYLSLNLLSDNTVEFSLNHYESKFHLNCRTKVALKNATAALTKFADMNSTLTAPQKTAFTDFRKTVKIFLRPKKEPVYMLLLLNIANSLVKTCQNYQESIASCQALLARRELRSRRRRTLISLLDNLPNIHKCLCSILECSMELFEKLQEIGSKSDLDNGDQLLRFLKHTLKASEKFFKYSHVESNEWIRAVELCSAFYELRERLFSKEMETQ